MAYRQWRDCWKLGTVEHTPWGMWQWITDKFGVTIVKVAVPAGNNSDLDLVLAAPRLHHACKMMVEAMEAYPNFPEPFDNDPLMMNAISEIKNGARLYSGMKHKKKGAIPEGPGGIR